MEQQRNSSGAMVAAVLLLLPVFYLSSYVVLVNPHGVMYRRSSPTLAGSVNFSRMTWHYYRYGGPFCEKLFWPLEQLDRKVLSWRWDNLDQRITPRSIHFEIYNPLLGKVESPLDELESLETSVDSITHEAQAVDNRYDRFERPCHGTRN